MGWLFICWACGTLVCWLFLDNNFVNSLAIGGGLALSIGVIALVITALIWGSLAVFVALLGLDR